ncbi:MAG: hypothetical protein IH987_15400 [Planctomycetes bacterium]|nr:hypothetical protein [Planctomycetota bacterium]
MNATLSNWLLFLRGADAVVCIPLFVGGVALMLFGWRIWKVCVVLCFVIAGGVLGQEMSGNGGDRLLYSFVGGAIAGTLSYKAAEFAASLLGGLIGTSLALEPLSMLGLTGLSFWLVTLVLLLSFSALSYINRQTVTVFVAAFLGAVLVVSGLSVCVMLSPSTYGYFYRMVIESSFVLPFILLVPTVMSCCYQISNVNRRDTGC